MKKTEKNINVLNLLSFVSLIIVAVLIVVNNLLPIIGIETKGAFFNVLRTIQEIFTVIVIGVSAYNFVAKKGKGLKIAFWIAIAIFVVGIVLLWF